MPSSGQIGTNQVVLPAYFANFEPAFGLVPGQNSLRVIRATQLSAGASHALAAGMTIEATGFFRDQDNGIPPVNLGGCEVAVS